MVNCAMCKRSFKTVASLKQHQMDAGHGGAVPKQVTVVRQNNRKSKAAPSPATGFQNQDIKLRFRRRELFATIESSKTDAFSYKYTEMKPANMGGATSALATKFEMYKLHSLRFFYKPAVSTMRDGQIVIAFDYNSKTTVAMTKAKMLGFPSAMLPVWKEGPLLSVKCDGQPRFTTDKDARDVIGMVYYANASAVDTKVTQLGDIFIELDIEFYGIDSI